MDAPVASPLYAPATHAVQTLEVDATPTLLYLPAAHAVQALDVVALARSLYAPTAHAVQAAAPKPEA